MPQNVHHLLIRGDSLRPHLPLTIFPDYQKADLTMTFDHVVAAITALGAVIAAFAAMISAHASKNLQNQPERQCDLMSILQRMTDVFDC